MCSSTIQPPVKCHQNSFLQNINEKDEASSLALILLNMRNDLDSNELVRKLWSKAALKVCADGGANRLHDSFENLNERAQYVPDVIVGDLDSLRPDVSKYYQQLGSTVKKEPDQDHNDFEKCLTVVKESKKPMTVVALGAFGGRFDHEMAAINLLYSYTTQFERLVLMGAGNIAFLLLPGITNVVLPDKRFEGPTVGLIPVGGACRTVTTQGLKWNLNGESLEFGKLVSSSNHVVDDVHIVTDAPLLWTAEFHVQEWMKTLSSNR